jgi:NitT/TauT family transport system ATP-binding protein
VIEIERVEKVFETHDGTEVHALAEISVAIASGEFVVFVGPSGCGKSTLLRLVAGLVDPTAGAVRIAGSPVAGPREDTGFVFQAPTLLPWASLLDNVLFPCRIMRTLDRDAVERATALIELAGLKGFESRMPRELSGGMQQRAAICRALVLDPAILLMDEPFGALDALTREEMSLELMRIWTERPKTILFVTHSVPEAVLLADRVVVLGPRPGRVIEIVPVRLPRPRGFHQESLPEFQDCAQRIRGHILGRRVH